MGAGRQFARIAEADVSPGERGMTVFAIPRAGRPLGYSYRCAYCNKNQPTSMKRKKTARGWKCGECKA
jgi:predicted SprT family Zn-dependent metalloprotease